MTTGSDRWAACETVPVHSSPAVNSSESPGRKKPMSSPVSANMTRNTPSVPRLASSEVVLSGLSAVTMAACLPAQASAERDAARFIPDAEV